MADWYSGDTSAKKFDAKNFGKTLGAATANWFDDEPNTYNHSLYAGSSDQTNGGIKALYSAGKAGIGDFNGATKFANGLISTAQNGATDPWFERALSDTLNDTYATTMASLGGTGRIGSSVHAAELSDALAGTEAQTRLGYRQQQINNAMGAAGMLPGLFEASTMPAQTMLQAGAIKDADRQASLMGKYDLWSRRNDADYNKLTQAWGLLNGAQGTQGVAKEAEKAPWWQQALGFVAGNAGQALKFAL